jgi:hypothetical protein
MTNHDELPQLASRLMRSTSWEGCCTVGDRSYHAFLCGDTARENYTLDLASGAFRLKVTRGDDGTWLSRRGLEQGWNKATAEEVVLAKDALRSAVRAERKMPVPETTASACNNVRQLPRQAAPVYVGMGLRSVAVRSLLAATFAFMVLALF